MLCLIIALWGIELEQVRQGFLRANYASLPILLGLLFFFFWLKAIRWRLLLQPLRDFRTKEVVPSLMIGFMGNNVLPAHLGELIRVFVLAREFSLAKAAVFSSVVLERLLDTAVVLIFLVMSFMLMEALPPWVEAGIPLMAVLATSTILLLAASLFWTQPFIRAAQRVFSLLPADLYTKLTDIMVAGALGLASLRRAELAFWVVLTSILQWVLMAGMVYVSLWSFGLHLPPLASFLVVGVTALGVTIPSAPGFFGVVQLCFWISLQLFGVEKADAFASSIYFHLSQYVPVTLLGLYYLNRRGWHLRQIDKEAAEEKKPTLTDSGDREGVKGSASK